MKKSKAQELTQAELQIMQVVWAKEHVFVKDVLAEMPEPKPAYNTVSTFIRILEKKAPEYARAFREHMNTHKSILREQMAASSQSR